jgi:multidrug resistance protein, MATE family
LYSGEKRIVVAQSESNDPRIDVISGNMWTGIWKLSWPLLLIMIFSFLVGITDVYVAGLISSDVQAAVGFITQIYFLVVIVANAIAIGTSALISRAIGAGEAGKAVETARQSLIMGSLISLIFTAACLLFYREIISLAGFPAQITEIAETFLKIFSFALGPTYILTILNAVFRASAEVIKPLLSMLILSLANIFLDFFLVFGIPPFPQLGYAGIAWATVLSILLGTLVNLLFLGFSRSWRPVYARPWSLSFQTILVIFNIGWPAASLQIVWNMTSISLFSILGQLKEASIVALAALSNGLRIEAIIYLPAFALNMAASVAIGQNLGAGDPDRGERMCWKIALVGMGITSTMALAIFVWAERLAAMLTGEPLVIAETARYLRFNMLSEPFMALGSILGGSLQGAGDTKGTMWVIMISMWAIRLPLASLLSLVMDFGAVGVWAAMVISMICQGIMMVWWFRRGKWKNLKLMDKK